MSDYLNNLLARTRNLSPVVQPRLASLFEPTAAADSNASRPLFAAAAMREAHAESESSPHLSPLIPTQTGQPRHVQSTIVVPTAPVQRRHSEGGERGESREDLSRHSLHPLSTVTPPPASSSLPTQPARTAPDLQPEAGDILRALRPLPQSPAPREAEEKAGPSPTITVSIGRVDVRAIISQQPAPNLRPAAQPTAALSLDEYLKQRSGGRR